MKEARQSERDSSPFVTLVHETDGVPVVKASGELDLLTTDRFRDALEEAVGSASDVLVVDLSGVEFMDSCGVNSLVGATRRFMEEGGTVRIVTRGSPAARTLRVTGLDRVFEVYPDVGSAAGRGVA